MQLPNASLLHQHSDRLPSTEEGDAVDNGKPHEGLTPCNTFMGKSLVRLSLNSADSLPVHVSEFLLNMCPSGTFGKAPWRPKQEPGFSPPSVTYNGITLHENPYTAPDVDSDHEDMGVYKDLSSVQTSGVYEHPFDTYRTDSISQPRMST